MSTMSSEPERVFSGGRSTLSDQRSSLKSETVELPEYPHSWFRLGILTEEDLLAIPSTLNEHGAMKALEAALDKQDGWSIWCQTVYTPGQTLRTTGSAGQHQDSERLPGLQSGSLPG